MPFTLDICNERTIEDPTDLQIRQAVLGLDLNKESAFVILGPIDEELPFIQASGDAATGFSVEHMESEGSTQLRAVNDFTADQLIAALIYFRDGNPAWRHFSPWEPVEL